MNGCPSDLRVWPACASSAYVQAARASGRCSTKAGEGVMRYRRRSDSLWGMGGGFNRRGPRRAPRSARGGPTRLDGLDVHGLGPLVAGLGVKGDPGALGERAKALGGDGGVMDEQVL